jgi:Ca2+-binding EF-hand superfamily protein
MRRFLGSLLLAAALGLALAAGPVNAQTQDRSGWKESFRLHDTNQDGRIDRAEFQAWMVDVFFRFDQDKKGYLTLADPQGRMRPEVFAAANRKGDGKLWLGEFLNARFLDFEAIDVTKQGSITVEEIEAYIRQAPR